MPAKVLSETELSKGDLWVFGYGSLAGRWRRNSSPPSWRRWPAAPGRRSGCSRWSASGSSGWSSGPPRRRATASSTATWKKHRASTVAYLRAREQVTSVYREVTRSVWLENEPRQRVSALAYVVDRGHVQYAGRLSLAEQLRHVHQGHGQSGANREYVIATVKAIEAEGFRDGQLHQLASMLHDDRPLHVQPPPEE